MDSVVGEPQIDHLRPALAESRVAEGPADHGVDPVEAEMFEIRERIAVRISLEATDTIDFHRPGMEEEPTLGHDADPAILQILGSGPARSRDIPWVPGNQVLQRIGE